MTKFLPQPSGPTKIKLSSLSKSGLTKATSLWIVVVKNRGGASGFLISLMLTVPGAY
jgi:hypothetical protein